jgi:hypothetical protein
MPKGSNTKETFSFQPLCSPAVLQFLIIKESMTKGPDLAPPAQEAHGNRQPSQSAFGG